MCRAFIGLTWLGHLVGKGKYKNDEAEQFDKNKLVGKIKSLIEDEDYFEKLDYIISELEICYTEQNDTKGPVDEMIYCGEKVKVIL